MSKIGIQLYSVREEAEKDFLGTIQKVADIGYEGIQFAGFYNTPAEQIKRLMEDNGLVSAGAHIGFDQLLDDKIESTFEFQHAIDNNLIICPAVPSEMRQSADDYRRTAETLNEIGKKCKEAGILFGYHNHDFEFERFGDRTGFDILFEHSEPELVKMELDCYWASFANQEPIDIIQKHKNRIVSLHIKDMKIGKGDQKTGTEVGNGQLDFESLVKMANDHHVEWFTVEQEEFDKDPFESLTININNLKKIMSKATVG